MASTYGTPVLFTKEKNVWTLACRLVFDNNGGVYLDPMSSKGICAANPDQVSFSGNTVGSSVSISSITSFSGLFNGMSVTGITGGAGTSTISSMNANTGVVTLASGTGVTTQPANALIATGGRYRIQFGQQSGVRLDTYVKLMSFNADIREVTASASGSATSLQFFPNAPQAFIVQNNIPVRTIPMTTTSGSTDASVVVQFGYYGADHNTFTAAAPKAGEVVHLRFTLGNSTAP